MSAQTSYDINQGKAYAGLIYALHPHQIDSRAVETVAGIGFGVAVGRGTDLEKQCVLGTAAYLGITVRSLDREADDAAGAIEYSQYETAAIMREGYVWVALPAGGNPGDAIKYTTATGVLDVGTAGVGETQLDGATLETVTAAGELGVVRLESTATTVGS